MVVDYPGHIWSKDSMRRLGRHIERSGVGRSLQYIFGAKVSIPTNHAKLGTYY
jgi:hypothetical protein